MSNSTTGAEERTVRLCGGHLFDYRTGRCLCGQTVALWINYIGDVACPLNTGEPNVES